MRTRLSYTSQMEATGLFHDFEDKLLKMATPVRDDSDPGLYFRPKIDLMEHFALGAYQWAIVDFADQRLHEVGGMVKEMTGKPAVYWKGVGADRYLSELALPEHIPYWMTYVERIYTYLLQQPAKFLHPQACLKMRNAEGIYRNVLMQFIDWRPEADGGVRYCLCQITDISHLEVKTVPQMTIPFAGAGWNPILDVPQEDHISLPVFTPRELEILSHLAAGLTSKLIADRLGIAKNTVENHRQNLLRKTGSSTSSELIAYTSHHGLI